MSEIAEAFRVGGPWMTLISAISCIAVLWTVVYTFRSARGRPWSALSWWIGPLAAVAVAGLGIGMQISEPLSVLEQANPEQGAELILKGTLSATYIAACIGVANALLGSLVSLGAGVANIVAAPTDGGRSRGIPATVLVVSLGSGAAVVVYGTIIPNAGPSLSPFLAPALVFGGIGAALAAVPEVRDESSGESVSRRLTAGFGVLCSVVFGVLASWSVGFLGVLEQLMVAAPENKQEFYIEGLAMLKSGVAAGGGIGLGAAAIIAVALVASAADGLSAPPVQRDALHCSTAAVVALAACVYAATQVSALSTALREEIVNKDWAETVTWSAPEYEMTTRPDQSPPRADFSG